MVVQGSGARIDLQECVHPLAMGNFGFSASWALGNLGFRGFGVVGLRDLVGLGVLGLGFGVNLWA